MKYKLSEKRADFLRDFFSEYSARKLSLDTATLDEISEPIELDYIAKNHNYGNDILIHIIKNKNVDFSTVKMIFFRSDLDGFLRTEENSDETCLALWVGAPSLSLFSFRRCAFAEKGRVTQLPFS